MIVVCSDKAGVQAAGDPERGVVAGHVESARLQAISPLSSQPHILSSNLTYHVYECRMGGQVSKFHVVPKLSSRGRDLLQRLLICNPAGRTSAADSMNHIYFSDLSPAVKNG